ncbi:tetratricopeptide repeat protein [Azospirillum doebereinerae]|uniref:Glycosyltransferase family 41 protein n=1 Tax=Azospirillum doebereinerae TaxID=92933 RepID=A0A433J1I3_9PROT|nr:tetratricopeptide repeat protein [Azospirillum doebereinerae]RUQ64065.1 glycosyltransferase family 41 protein [Azospirillum doebereinerae]
MGNPTLPSALFASLAPADGPKLLDDAERLLRDGNPEAADLRLSRAIALAPADPRALGLAGVASHLSGRSDQALRRFGWTVHVAPGHAAAHNDLCEALRRRGRLEEALAHGRLAAALEPDRFDILYNLGIVYYDRLEIDRAILWERRAVRLAPEVPGPHFELAEGLLLSGCFPEGWQEYEWRFRLPGVPPPVPPSLLESGRPVPRPPWDGRPMPSERLLLIADQGFGDVVQFARYIPLAERLCPDFVIAGSPETLPILRQVSGGRRCHQDWESLPDFDRWCPLSGLPRLFGTTLATIPAEIPYLHADPERAAWWKERLDGLLPKGMQRIGLVWAGRPSHGNDQNRSMRLQQLKPLFDLDKVALVSLQVGPTQAEIGRYFGKAPLVNLGAGIGDFDDTMAILQSLDRLVSVDTAVAHLAGAMGVPTSILLPFAPDWRWLLKRGDTPWYPAVTLHRQTSPGRWDEPVRAMVASLRFRRR